MINTDKSKIILSIFLNALLIFLQILIVNFDSTSGKEFDRLSSSLKEIQYENALLSQKIASESSILSIARKAEKLGFNSNKTVVSLYNPQPLAAAEIAFR